MPEPLFIATERFDPSDGERWQKYIDWAKIPALAEIVGLDSMLCPHLPEVLSDEDWKHIVNEDFRLDYFLRLDYLLTRVRHKRRRNVLGLYRNPAQHITEAPAKENFSFMGYELIEEQTQISALNNCGGFPDVFRNEELNSCGLILSFERATEVKLLLAEKHPEEPHAQCELYAIWLLNEGSRRRNRKNMLNQLKADVCTTHLDSVCKELTIEKWGRVSGNLSGQFACHPIWPSAT